MRKRITALALWFSLGMLAALPGGAQEEEEAPEEARRELYRPLGPSGKFGEGLVNCPYNKPTRCYDGECVYDAADCRSPPTCISGKRFRCPNGACVTDYGQCSAAPPDY